MTITITHAEGAFVLFGNCTPLSVPNQERCPFVAENFVKDAYPHKRHYTPAEFEALLNEAGWDVLERHCQKHKTADVEWGTDGMFLVYVCR